MYTYIYAYTHICVYTGTCNFYHTKILKNLQNYFIIDFYLVTPQMQHETLKISKGLFFDTHGRVRKEL